jgi:flagellar hook-basal body complex protein FliE
MVMNVADALAAYRQSGDVSGNGAGGADETGGESFAATLKGFAGDAVKALQDGEKAATGGTTGKVGIAGVVTALDNAQLMLQTVVTIRDKVIAAYQDITKTSI